MNDLALFDAPFTATVRAVSEDEVRHLDSALPKEVTVDRSVYTATPARKGVNTPDQETLKVTR